MIRKTVRESWAIRPMEEWGVGPLREKERLWDELFSSPWDRQVRIYKVTFAVETFTDSPSHSAGRKDSSSEDDAIIVTLSLEFGPMTKILLPDSSDFYGDIGQVISFKVFDSQGVSLFLCCSNISHANLRNRLEFCQREVQTKITLFAVPLFGKS
jgi:hypothetical protein